MKTIRTFIIIIAVILVVVLVRLIPEKRVNHITIGFQPGPSAAILMVANDKGFFEKNDLDVELKEFTAGKFALAALFGGSLDFAVSGDVPPFLAAIQGNEFFVPFQLVKKTTGEIRVVARKDGEIVDPKEYFGKKKRKLATSAGGGPELFTYEFLKKLNINKDQIEIINQKPEDMVPAIANGSVDAIAVFDPIAFFAERKLGKESISFADESVYSEIYLLSARVGMKDSNQVLEKIRRSMSEAEEFIKSNPVDAKSVVETYTKLDLETINDAWKKNEFAISISPEMRLNWNKICVWAKETAKLQKSKECPSFDKYFLENK